MGELLERTHITSGVRSRAVFAPCERYRYLLQRRFDGLDFEDPGSACFVMMNPSTADERQDDPTIRRCIGYARAWGYVGVTIVNVFALRSTNPKGLLAVDDPVGPANPEILMREALEASLLVCAWGLPPKPLREKAESLLGTMLVEGLEPHALRLTKDGSPAHPLYLPASLRPFRIGGSHAA